MQWHSCHAVLGKFEKKNNPGYGYEEWKIMHEEDGK